MKKFVFSALATLLLSLPVFGLTPAETKAHAASYQIGQATRSGGGDPDELLFDLQAFPGESGAGVFGVDGKLIAVISATRIQVKEEEGIAFASAYRFNFKPEDLARALAFSAEVKK